MTAATGTAHRCYRCVVHDVQEPFRVQGQEAAAPLLDSIETTFSDDKSAIFFASGYSAREIAQKHARETGFQVYVNNVSRSVRRKELTVAVAYAVAASAVYTLKGPDRWHDKVYRAYWPPL